MIMSVTNLDSVSATSLSSSQGSEAFARPPSAKLKTTGIFATMYNKCQQNNDCISDTTTQVNTTSTASRPQYTGDLVQKQHAIMVEVSTETTLLIPTNDEPPRSVGIPNASILRRQISLIGRKHVAAKTRVLRDAGPAHYEPTGW